MFRKFKGSCSLFTQVRALCHFVSHHCAQSSAGEGSGIKMFTFTTLPLSLNFQDFLQLRVKLGLIAFSARCNGAAASETWPSFWPNMSYFWPRGIEYITPFTVFSTDFAFDELHISAEEEWRKLSSEEMERYEDICSEVKRVYELTHPPVQSKWHQRLQMLSQSCNPLRMLTSGLENRRNERRNQRLQRQAREVQDAQNNAGEVANQPRSSAISQVYSLVTSPLNLIRSRNGPTALNTNSGTANTTPLLNPNGTASGSSNNERNQNQNGTANGETPGSNRSITRDNVNGATSTSTANTTDATRNLSLADNSLNTPPPVQRSLSISSPIRSMPSLSLTGISNSMPRPNNLMSSFGNVLRRGNTGNNGNMNQQQNGGTDRNNGNASANNNNNQSILNESGGRDHGSPVLRSRSPTRLRESHYDWTLHNQHLNNEHNLNLAISNYTREVQSLRQNIQNQTDQFQNMMNNSQNQNGNQSNQLQSPIQLEPPLSPTHNIDSPQAQRMTANHSLGLFRPNFDVQGSTNLETANQLINPDANTLTGTSLDSDNNNMNTLQNQNIASSDANINDPDMLNMNPITGPIISSQYARSLNSPSDAEGPTPSSSPILRRDLSSYNSWDQGPMSPDNHTVAHDWNNMSMTLTPYNSNPVLLGSTTVPMNIATDVNDAFSSNNMAQCQNADSGSASSSSSVTGGGTGVSSAVNGTNIVDIGSSNVRGNSSPTNGGASANTRFQNEAQNRVLQQAAQQQALLESSMNRALCNYLETALKTGALRSTGIVRSLQDKFLLNRSGNYYDDDITGNSGSYNDFNNVSLTGGGPGLMPFGNMNNNLGMFGSGTALNQNRLSNRNPNFSEGQLALDGLMRSLGSELQSVGAQYQCQGLSMTNRQGTMSGYNGNNINDMGNFNSLNDMNNSSSGLSQYQDADRLLLQNELNRGQHANGPLRQSQTNPGSPTSSSRGLNSSDIAAARLYRDRMIMLDSYLQAMNISESGIANNGGNVLNSSNLSPTTSVTERDRDVHNLLSSRHLTGTSAMQARQYRRRSLQGLQQSLQSRTDSPVSLSREFLDEAELILLGLLREGRERRRARRLLIHGDRTNRRSNSNTHNRNSSDSDGGNLSTRLNDGVSTVPTRTGSTSNTNIHQTSRSLPSSPLGLMSQNYLRMHQGDLTNLPGLDPMSSDSTNNNMIHSSVANGNGNNAGTGGNNLNLSSGTSTINVNTNYLAVDGPITSSMASTTFASSVATTATNYSIDIYPRSEPGSSCSVSPNDNYLVPQQKLNNTKEDLLAYPLARLTGVDSDDNQGIRLASSTQTVSTRVNAMSSTGSNNHCPKNPTNDPTFMNYSGSDGTSYTDAENSSKGSK